MFIKMSNKWYCVEFDFDNIEDRDNMRSHIDNGNIVAFSDDIENFAMDMEISVNDIEEVE